MREFRTKPKPKGKLSLSAVLSNKQEIQRSAAGATGYLFLKKLSLLPTSYHIKDFYIHYGAEAQ